MIIKQLSVFVQNESGRLFEVTQALADAEINISALNIVEAEEYGVLRIIVDDTSKATAALKDQEYSVALADVLCVAAEDKPGSLNKVLKCLSEAKVNVKYMYGYSDSGVAKFIIKVKDPARAEQVLKDGGLL